MDLQDPLKPRETADEEALRLGARHGPVALWEPGQALPVFCTLDGVDVAIVAAADYRELLALKAKASFADVRAVRDALPPRGPRLGLSTIERDPEVADFLRERFRSRVTIGGLHADCLERFGAERTPSQGRIGVFRQRARRR